jgi:signal transduction histidine kinase/CBS domain-containing protein
MTSLKVIANTQNFHIDYKSSIKEAMEVMHKNKNGSVILLKEAKPIAIITESDIVKSIEKTIDLKENAFKIASKNLVFTNENRPIEFAFDLLIQHSIRRLILVDKEGLYKGVVLQKDLFEYVEEDVYKVDLSVSNILKDQDKMFSLDISSTIEQAVVLMQKYNIGSIPVMKDNACVGILTEKDILKISLFEIEMKQNISSHMSKPVISVKTDTLVTEVIELMKVKNIRRVIVLNKNNELCGLLTNRDILKHIKGNYTRILQNKIKHAQEIMDFLPEPIIEIFYSNNEEIIYWMNEQSEKSFGNMVEKNVSTLFTKKQWEDIKEKLDKKKSFKNKHITINKKVYEISGTISKNMNTNFIKLIFKDVTNYEEEKNKLQNLIEFEIKKRMESEYLLMQQAKLATMGEMIGHIAHQWRQPLAQLGGIFMNIESAYLFEELNEKYLNEKITHGNKLIKYMSNTIEDFRHFFEPNKQKEEFYICEYIENAINILKASLTYHHIKVEFENEDKDIKIVGFPSEFSQVILNILANAQDILVEKNIKKPYIKIDIKEYKNKFKIKIKDNGGGIKEDVIDKIFDNYFTTKSKKEGTGLGLYISKLIIETKMNGEITVSNSKKGACFSIVLDKNMK